MQILRKWNYKTHTYDAYKVPDTWNCKTYSNNMNTLVSCCQCGRKVKFGDCYTSLEVHTDMGIGYSVCEKCYKKEYEREQKFKRNK